MATVSELLTFTEKGIYCERGDFYIDPWKPVDRALITHGHSDHARPGSRRYMCTELTRPILNHRIGSGAKICTRAYGETFSVNGVKCSFHPAGHILGSAQIRVEHKGEVWVASGDYKTAEDNISGSFEPVQCHAFITECTFGLPVYKWRPQEEVISEINAWWQANRDLGVTSVISAYSLGKAQRVLQNVDHSIGPVLCHGAVEAMNTVLRESGVKLKPSRYVDDTISKSDLAGALVIAPGSALGSPWMKRFKRYSSAAASGWMAIRGRRRWQAVDRGFVLSDHADWTGLNSAVKATGASTVIATHGYTDIFARWLREQGLDARTEKTFFEESDSDDAPHESAE